MSKLLQIPVKGFWVTCIEEEDESMEFGPGQLDEARHYFKELRKEYPNYDVELIAQIDA